MADDSTSRANGRSATGAQLSKFLDSSWFGVGVGLAVTALAVVAAFAVAAAHGHQDSWILWATGATVIVTVPIVVLAAWVSTIRDRTREEEARKRVRTAQEALRELSLITPLVGTWTRTVEKDLSSWQEHKQPVQETDSAPKSPVPETSKPAGDDRLALVALWAVTDERIDLYHRIATGQARRSFFTAQLAMATGFLLLIVFAVLAARATTPAAAITSGGLGAVAAAFAGHIGRTFVRSQESAASHLRAYFDNHWNFLAI